MALVIKGKQRIGLSTSSVPLDHLYSPLSIEFKVRGAAFGGQVWILFNPEALAFISSNLDPKGEYSEYRDKLLNLFKISVVFE